MKIKQVSQPSDRTLFEALDQDNDTGFATEDLVKIVRAYQEGAWSKPQTYDEFMQEEFPDLYDGSQQK